MARRSDIDWEQVERLYIAGQLTLRQIADECGIHLSTLTAKAKAKGWQRNCAELIEARAKEKIAQIDIAQLIDDSAQASAQKSAVIIRDAVEQAAEVKVGVLLRHRAMLKLQMERAEALEALLDEHCREAVGLGDVVKASQAYRNLVDARCRLIELERQAFGFNKQDDVKQHPAAVVSISF